ncbi:MAG: hypothetical protein M0Z48_07520 [Nitrospiraceae bacterium]|nr:hypothetical protein [Nitrospiraceae bacterium]
MIIAIFLLFLVAAPQASSGEKTPENSAVRKILAVPDSEKILDRTVAFVGDDAILLSELETRYTQAVKLTPDITKAQVLQTMINRLLLLREARKIFPETMDDEQAIREFTDFKIRAFVVVPEDAVRDFYEKNKAKMGGAPYEQMRGQIERLLKEKEINRSLQSYLQGLREKAYIRVFLTNTPSIFH